ncbi:leucine--tRNA ligase [Candidatus Aerophobetes bacterium]|uniref:Leucine--tRNA ligase n=1 Tax=Aerophobetes bacterium TaxID=2030807 RepID=A0A2A4X4A8_UNCAE|nr:MAG: leucine--tRNA ligase [Candidatus Aerophobetes bacterium]
MKKRVYDHKFIEKKWQKHWEETGAFKAEYDQSKPKYYVLDMFPYPSGAGLHVGHVTGYTASDIVARLKRQKGYNVLHPMGWDSFGLQAEQYAVRTGTHPRDTTVKNIATYTKQLKSLGFSYDWDRAVTTSEPDYYKWTQWIFTKLYEKGLAYEANILVNYCPKLGTVLANEEVEDGFSKEGGYPIERRPLKQWVLKITEYADRLLEDLEDLDWPEYLKTLQRNWIGKSEGMDITFLEETTRQPINVYTTRVDTLAAVTFLVLSPEHPLLDTITSEEAKEGVKQYQKQVASKSDLERTELSKEKTGVFSGAFALNPLTKKPMPIWVADYVLMSYGTGAVMGVPGADERDFEFARKFSLPVLPPYDPGESLEGEDSKALRIDILSGKALYSGEGTIVCESQTLPIHGLTRAEAQPLIEDYLQSTKQGSLQTRYKLRDWLFSRQRYWGEPFPILHFEDGSKRCLELNELPLELPSLEDYKPGEGGTSPLEKATDFVFIHDEKTGKNAKREVNTMPQWAGSCWYYLRFCDPHNKDKAWDTEIEKYWMNVDLYIGGVEHAVLHLLYARFWHKVLYDLNLVSTKEPFSSMRNQGLITSRSYKRRGGEYIDPKDVEKREDGYYHKGSGEKLLSMIEKMSKSKLNGVSPDAIIEEFGADTLRLYEMFLGPFDKEKIWDGHAIYGCKRFLDRYYDLVFSAEYKDEANADEKALSLVSKMVWQVEKDIEVLSFNTAIAKMMETLNYLVKSRALSKQIMVLFTQALYPIAPHIAEEAFLFLTGSEKSLTFHPYPKIDLDRFKSAEKTYVFQVNGKVRGRYTLPADTDKEALLKVVKEDEKMAKYFEGTHIVKEIFVPGKLLNIVVKS